MKLKVGFSGESLLRILPIWVNLIDPAPEARREHYGMQMGRFVCVFSSRVVALSTEVRNINVLWPFFRSSVSITSYAVWPQPQGRLLAHLPDVQPIAWRRGTVSPESANFPLFPLLSASIWRLEIPFQLFAGDCDNLLWLLLLLPRAMPKRGTGAALRRLLSGSYLLFLCEIGVRFRALLEVCRISSAFFLLFQLSFFHFHLGCSWLVCSLMLGLPVAVNKWPPLTHSLLTASRVQFGMWDSGELCWVFEGICVVVRGYPRPLRILPPIFIR